MSAIDTYRVGDAEVTRVTEQTVTLPIGTLFPDHVDEIGHNRLEGEVELSIHSWVVRTAQHLIVIDTATGNGRDRGGNAFFHNLQTDYPARLAAAGVGPEAVDFVLLTHLHIDHVGWNTRWAGECWAPMFPNATYVMSAKELDIWRSDPARATMFADSIEPVLERCGVKVVDPATNPTFAGALTYHHSPGHSPDHASIALASNGAHALFGGDVLHHPVQARFPHWNSTFCEDKPRAVSARAWALDWCARHEALYFSSHFAESSAGTITPSGGATGTYNWQFK
ncbi:MAG: MBL fold metallo-hydrolase [Salinisphaera sp.]|uniref:MBL fold metallo-hydrolase n=1 Tax=Salinisphaera sp. TaxID=1914330 RepID=UPI003C7DB3A5